MRHTKARELPREKLGKLMTAVSRLGSRPKRLLESVEPSSGEIRKILLAMGIANVPHLILIMDEPSNHLDLPCIECLEQPLLDCPWSAMAGASWMRWPIGDGIYRKTGGEGQICIGDEVSCGWYKA